MRKCAVMLALLLCLSCANLTAQQQAVQGLDALVGEQVVAQHTPLCLPGTQATVSSYAGKLARVVSVKPATTAHLSEEYLSGLSPEARAMMEDQQKAATILVQFGDGTQLDTCGPVTPTNLSSHFSSGPSPRQSVDDPLTNRDVMAMRTAKFDDATVIKMIEMHETKFDLSVVALTTLKAAGVSDAVLQAMLSATPENRPTTEISTALTAESPAARTDDLPDEVGVYIRQHGKLVAIEPEIVNWRTGGVAKNIATLGLDKGHINGTVSGPHSQLTVAWPSPGSDRGLEFYIRCPEGNSASEYQLLRLWGKSDRREFRAITGGILHRSGGAKDNDVSFNFEKVASRTYRISLNSLALGDYGFLAPGAVASANVASNGKIYTFRILE